MSFWGRLSIPKLSVQFLILIALGTACNPSLDEPDPDLAHLEVYVTGTLGNPKNDARVSIHRTEEDARDNIRPVVKPRYTNSDGIVNFVNIEPGLSYWIRTKPLVYPAAFTETDLNVGENYLDVITL